MFSIYDMAVMILGLVGLFFWIQGVRKKTMMDVLIGLVVGVLAGVVYFTFFQYTRVPWLAGGIFGVYLVGLFAFTLLKTNLSKILMLLALMGGIGAFALEFKWMNAGNSILVIQPYRTGAGGWAFDAPAYRLKAEPFVKGIPEFFEKMMAQANIPAADKQIRVIFSQNPFPDHQAVLTRMHEENGGN